MTQSRRDFLKSIAAFAAAAAIPIEVIRVLEAAADAADREEVRNIQSPPFGWIEVDGERLSVIGMSMDITSPAVVPTTSDELLYSQRKSEWELIALTTEQLHSDFTARLVDVAVHPYPRSVVLQGQGLLTECWIEPFGPGIDNESVIYRWRFRGHGDLTMRQV